MRLQPTEPYVEKTVKCLGVEKSLACVTRGPENKVVLGEAGGSHLD